MKMTCRICGAEATVDLGEVEYVTGYKWSVSDCTNCGCRFTRHDESVHDQFHQSGAISYYAGYRDLAAETGRMFAAGDKDGLRRYLCATASKYRMVLDLAAQLPPGADCLEIGCSRGYLTSSLILDHMNVLGVDVSAEAVASATDAFGDHFALAGTVRAENGGPYDFIYHVGVIGCVADPLGLTRSLLQRLKPGGKLVFNAPNLQALSLRDQLWMDSAPPPDLVTLFPPGFWKEHFGDEASVVETIDTLPLHESFLIMLRRWFGRRWSAPAPQPMGREGSQGRTWQQPSVGFWPLFERVVSKVARMTGLMGLAPPQPAEFGLFVSMIKPHR